MLNHRGNAYGVVNESSLPKSDLKGLQNGVAHRDNILDRDRVFVLLDEGHAEPLQVLNRIVGELQTRG